MRKEFRIQSPRTRGSQFRIAVLLCVICGICGLLWAATGTVAPDGDNTTGSWTTAPLFSKVDEDIDSSDGNLILSPNNPSSPTNDVIFEITTPADVGTITEANLRVRASKGSGGTCPVTGGRDISLAVSWSATTATNFSTGSLGGAANYESGNQTGLSISKATADASTLRLAPSTSGGGPGRQACVDTLNLDIAYDASGARKRAVIALREPQP
jgi:hypothetical protein